jgi:hypothetical protein
VTAANLLLGLLEDEAQATEEYGRDHGQYGLVGKGAAIRNQLEEALVRQQESSIPSFDVTVEEVQPLIEVEEARS